MSDCALVRRLVVDRFRNLKNIQFDAAPRLNLISGDNGHGKTSLIEALYVLCTTKSFRTAKLLEVIQESQNESHIAAKAEVFGLERELRAVLRARSKVFSLDGKKPARRIQYALEVPVIAFHPGELHLSSGPASIRRTLLDRIILYQDPLGTEARLRYQKALRERARLLSESTLSHRELDAYEVVIAQEGAQFARARARAAEQLLAEVVPTFARIAANNLDLHATYLPGGSADKDEFLQALGENRQKDRFRGRASFGPHRDEVELRLDGRAARKFGSQGQQRLLALSLKLAELTCVKKLTGHEPLLLLDDVSSELDPERTGAVFEFLRERKNQLFVTTTRPELFSPLVDDQNERADFAMIHGRLESRKPYKFS
ncbi:MAG: DNA replication and repair protein RecF [Polyangiaceae bacterium]|nr:DNA replication and repair protein RecF [Polyangiaceae bacterium]